MNNYYQRTSEIIKKILYITIASVTEDGKPWNTPVYSACDSDLNFYWASDKNSHHSQNIRTTKNVFLVIYDSTVPEGTGEGVYCQAVASELNNQDEAMAALKILDGRVGKTKVRDFADYSGDACLRVYKATPKLVWMNGDEKDDNGDYVRDIRIAVSMSELKRLLRPQKTIRLKRVGRI